MLPIQLLFLLCFCFLSYCSAVTIDFSIAGGISDSNNLDDANSNTALFNTILSSLQAGDTFLIPSKTFYFNGGIYGENIYGVTIQIDGYMSFLNVRQNWPTNENGNVLNCINFRNITSVLFTSSNPNKGTIDGNGQRWWGAIKFLVHGEDRPMLFRIDTSKDLIVENLLFKDSPFWTTFFSDSDGLIVRYCNIDARWDKAQTHDLLDLQAFNTDGFDVTGRNVHMHDLNIWNDDDCVCVKDGSENMLFERINASGLGLVIGSIGNSIVRNITFRDAILPNTFKGIYMKTRWEDGPSTGSASISDILFENITIYNPEQWAIWMGPAQQTGQPCPLYWPQAKHSECLMSGFQTWNNITLRDVTIYNPVNSPGVLIGNASNPMKNVIFDNVVVVNPGVSPWGEAFYDCTSIEGVAKGTTFPVPPCFKKE